MFQNGFNHKILQCNNDSFFTNPINKPLTSEVQSKFTSIGYCIQPIKLLDPSPSTLELENTIIKPINNKAYYKLHYQICLHKSERISSKIKLKVLKPSLTIPRQVPLPKGELNKHVVTYVVHVLRTYVMILCNWLIF